MKKLESLKASKFEAFENCKLSNLVAIVGGVARKTGDCPSGWTDSTETICTGNNYDTTYRSSNGNGWDDSTTSTRSALIDAGGLGVLSPSEVGPTI